MSLFRRGSGSLMVVSMDLGAVLFSRCVLYISMWLLYRIVLFVRIRKVSSSFSGLRFSRFVRFVCVVLFWRSSLLVSRVGISSRYLIVLVDGGLKLLLTLIWRSVCISFVLGCSFLSFFGGFG